MFYLFRECKKSSTYVYLYNHIGGHFGTTVESRAVDLSTIQFWSILTKGITWCSFFSEAMLESIPQTHILIFLAGKEPGLIIGEGNKLFWATFASSFLTASFALAKFLKTGKVIHPKSRRQLKPIYLS